MLACELAQPVSHTQRPGTDGLVTEIAPDVRCQVGGSLIALRPILGDGLHGDPVEIAAQLTIEGSSVCLPESRDVGGLGVFESRDLGAWFVWLLVSDNALDLRVAGAGEGLSVEWQCAHEELVKQNTE
jgi:hypothetical protein